MKLKLVTFAVAFLILWAFLMWNVGLPGVRVIVGFSSTTGQSVAAEDIEAWVKYAMLITGLMATGFAIEIASAVGTCHQRFLRQLR